MRDELTKSSDLRGLFGENILHRAIIYSAKTSNRAVVKRLAKEFPTKIIETVKIDKKFGLKSPFEGKKSTTASISIRKYLVCFDD